MGTEVKTPQNLVKRQPEGFSELFQQSKCRETEASSNFVLKAVAQDLNQDDVEQASPLTPFSRGKRFRLGSFHASIAPSVSPSDNNDQVQGESTE